MYSNITTPMTFHDVINDKYDNIHEQLYNQALNNYLGDNRQEYESTYRMIELKSSYFNQPSKVLLIRKHYPHTRTTIDLTSYWGDYGFKEDLSYLKLDDDFTVETGEVIYKDYIKGTATLYSRYSGKKFTVKLSSLPDDIKECETLDPTLPFETITIHM